MRIIFIALSLLAFSAQAQDECDGLTTSEKISRGCDTSVSYELGSAESTESCESMSVTEKIKADCNLDEKFFGGRTALMKAVAQGNKDDVKLLLRKGADVNIKDNSDNTALMIAVAEGRSQIFDIILAANPRVSTKNSMGNTALTLAQSAGNDEMEIQILARTSNLNFCDYTYNEISEYFSLAYELVENSSNTRLENFKTELQTLKDEAKYNERCGNVEDESEVESSASGTN